MHLQGDPPAYGEVPPRAQTSRGLLRSSKWRPNAIGQAGTAVCQQEHPDREGPSLSTGFALSEGKDDETRTNGEPAANPQRMDAPVKSSPPQDCGGKSGGSSYIHILFDKAYPDRNIETSRWYLFCKKVRKKHIESAADSWEPPRWQWVCPEPFFPTYRQFARLVGITMVVLLLWGCAYAIFGEPFAPGGQLFDLAALTVAAHCGGWLVSLVTIPGLVGMLLTGILVQNVGLIQLDGQYRHVESTLRKIALVIILTRAGLDLDPRALKRLVRAVLRIGLLPWLVESVVIAVLFNVFLGFPWVWSFLIGVVVAAVSPAVVVACLFRLRAKGYGVAKGIPTLIIAISGIDDAASVAAFGIIFSLLSANGSLLYQIGQGPLSIVLGLGFGAAWGKLAKYVPEKNDPFAVSLRVLLLFAGGLIAVLGSEAVGLAGVGPLAVVTAAFVSCHSWSQQGWDVEENPVSTAFQIFWMVFEPILFGLTGMQIKLDELNPGRTTIIIGCLLAGFVIRIVVTGAVAVRNKLNMKEKVFVALSLMSKASVQAALAPVPLDSFRGTEHEDRADVFLTTCVLSILLTAPSVAVLMTLLGPRLLTKTPVDPDAPENWRRHTRPSLRDISIVDEDDDVENCGGEEVTSAVDINGDPLSRKKSHRSSERKAGIGRRVSGYDNSGVVCDDVAPPPVA